MPTICITGASSGIGEATARRFAAQGWHVVATARRGDRLEALAKDYPGLIHILVFDVQNPEAVTSAFASLPSEYAEIDVLVNNAGLALGLESAQNCDMADWEAMINTNIKGLLYCSQAVLPAMAQRGKGHIVNIGSIAGSYAYPGGNVYGATKAFVEQFSRNLRCDLHGTGIRVTNVEPGLLETEFSLVRFKGDATAAGSVYDGSKPLHAEDIAEIIWWAATLPEHVNINRVEVMPTCQSNGPTRTWKG